MIVRIVAGAPEAYLDFTHGYVIAVDKGVQHCINNDIQINLAIGDFDSYDPSKLDVPKIVLNPIKDDTDMQVAINEAIKLNPERIYVYGASNGRLDHYLANINMLGLYDIVMIDAINKAYVKSESFTISSNDYVSFFRFDGNPVITLKGFKYPLTDYILQDKDNLCVSNEITQKGEVFISGGRILVIESKKD